VTTVDAAALLWTDVDFEASLLAARGRLVTLRAAVAANEVLSSADVAFLGRADQMLATPPAQWTDPRLAWWTVTATALLAATLGIPTQSVAISPSSARSTCEGWDRRALRRLLGGREPHTVALPGWDKSKPAVAAGVAYHEARVPLVEQALAAIRRYARTTSPRSARSSA